MSLWFRAYSEVLNDPKIQRLPLDAFKAWHNALYLAGQIDSRDGVIGTLDDVSFAFRETKEAVSSAFQHLLDSGLIVTVGETFQIVSWKKRQYKSDTSTDRVKRFRERSRNVTETAPDTDTDTEKNIITADAAYAFSGSVIRLKQDQWQKWEAAFKNIDLRSSLQSRDDWLANEADEATRKKWFMSTSNYLRNLNQQSGKQAKEDWEMPC